MTLEKFIEQLNKLAKKADKLNIRLGNGAEVGSMLGSMADDLSNQLRIESRTGRQ